MNGSNGKRRVVCVGDQIEDQHWYEIPAGRPDLGGRNGVRPVFEPGGVHALKDLLEANLAGEPGWVVTYAEAAGSAAGKARAYANWRPVRCAPDDPAIVWRARLLGYDVTDGEAAEIVPPAGDMLASVPEVADVMAIHDADLGFRTRAKLGPWLDGEAPPAHIVLRMSTPLARGDLWQTLVTHHASRLICVVSATDLRESHSAVSEGQSWERTLTDLQAALQHDPVLSALARCRLLVVCFAQDGALAIPGGGASTTAQLVFDPRRAEGEFAADRDGDVTGHLTCMAAALASWALKGAVDADLVSWLRGGIAAMRNLIEKGHGDAGAGAAPPAGFPAARLAGVMMGEATGSERSGSFADVTLPWSPARRLAPGWTILLSSQKPPEETRSSVLGLAHLLVRRGLAPVLDRQPHAAFGDLRALDWSEIEALRGIRRAMLRYRGEARPPRPLSIGVFGPPGAGKSFGVREIAKEIFGRAGWLEFNMSQFERAQNLKGPFHQVRDAVLNGLTPVVLWDEFDTADLRWLQYLIGPMQDGRFQDEQLSHSIGKAVFVFAGGTRHTFTAFDRTADADETRRNVFRACKGPDFVSRLDAYLNVIGPNPREGGGDRSYTVRRAQLIRHHLSVARDAVVDVDPDLLNALLLVPRYEHGSRSLEKLVKALRGDGQRPIRTSALPPPEVLGLAVDRDAFRAILDRNAAFRSDAAAIDVLAAAIHDAYREHMERMGTRVDPRIDRPFKELGTGEKEDNRAAARRIVDVLALIGMGVARRGDGPSVDAATYDAYAKHHIERLAEAEHDGWMAHRLANGWHFARERDYAARLHPSLRPYAKLPDSDKAKDKDAVLSYWRRIDSVGFDTVWLEPDDIPDPAAHSSGRWSGLREPPATRKNDDFVGAPPASPSGPSPTVQDGIERANHPSVPESDNDR